MAKLAFVSALLVVVLLAVAAEASFRTIISATIEEESQWGEREQQPQRCQQQIQQRRQQLRQCEQMMSQKDGEQQQQRQCCQGLENLDRQCRCEAVNQMVQKMMQGQGQEQSEMMEMARHLPDMCNLEPRQCQIQSPSFRTTILDEESQQPQRCQQQIQQKRQQLRQCEQMLSQQGRRDSDDQQQQQQRQCCQGLESLDRQCRCDAVNQMVQDMMQGQGQGQGRQASQQSEMMEKARHLPDMCNLEPHQCQIQSPSFISTVVDEERQQPQRCQQQIQHRRQQLRQCEQMLSQQGRHSDMEMTSQHGEQQQQRQCCQGLENLDRQCRCEAVNQMVQDMMQGQGQGQERQGSRQSEMMEKARYLPDMCNLEPRQCQIQSPYF